MMCIKGIYRKALKQPERRTKTTNNTLKLKDYLQNIQFVYISLSENILFISKNLLTITIKPTIDLFP